MPFACIHHTPATVTVPLPAGAHDKEWAVRRAPVIVRGVGVPVPATLNMSGPETSIWSATGPFVRAPACCGGARPAERALLAAASLPWGRG